ncbi:MAG TPA: oligopeptide transporter, OPT family [Polyangiaceae bacterium LLY-WYZ-15_(1-7)]|nr:oligopeptide transporter, OPT family [Polyangiaceae bacterium LLY-WYZ-15_(1-7)]
MKEAPEKPKEPKLPPQAYEPLAEGEVYEPVVGDDESVAELSLRSIGIGVVVGVLFGAANAYLGLKVGLTVSASIPAAVIGVAFFRLLRGGTILETNIVQTIGSAGESLAAGVIFTLPVLFLWEEDPGFWPIFPLALLGGLLGVLFMIPLRRFLIVREHGKLTYPEGTACAEVQVAAQAGGTQARLLFGGMLVGAIYTAVEKFLRLWPAEPDLQLGSRQMGYRTSVGADVTPELLGVGYIIGPKVAAVMLAGGAVGWLVLIPAIYLFGDAAAGPIAPESEALIRDMGSFEVWSRYLRYVGAGAVAFGGLFTLVKSLPTIVQSLRLALHNLGDQAQGKVPRTDTEIPLPIVGGVLLLIALAAAFLPLRTDGGSLGLVAALAVVVFSFFFVTVSSRIVGLIGSSSNPISGMTIATVLICALLFGGAYAEGQARVAVLTIGALVCIAAAIAGDTSQDLKTGYLVGATPRRQQIGELVGVLAAALAMSTVLTLFKANIVDGTFKAPQANLIRLVIDGVLDANLPWGLVFIGMAMAFCVEIMGLPTLAFAVGLYLPIHLAVPIMAGGLLRLAVEKLSTKEQVEERRERGVLYGSGLIAGAALIGVAAAGFTFFELDGVFVGEEAEPHEWLPATAAFGLLAAILAWVAFRKKT